MTKYLLSIDPGLSSGLALLKYEGDTAPELVDSRQFSGGAEALNGWIADRWPSIEYLSSSVAVIAEKFNARNTGSFSYTTASLEPLRCEGVLLAHNLPDKYVQPPQQYFAGGKGKVDKKKRQHRALKDLGFYVTGSMVDSADADDVRSAIAHGLAYLARTGHRPTYTMLSEWNERNV